MSRERSQYNVFGLAAPLATSVALAMSGSPAVTEAASTPPVSRAKVEQLNHRTSVVAHKLGGSILAYCRRHRAQADFFYGHGQDGVGASISIATNVSPKHGDTVNYAEGVTFGYKNGKVDWANVINITATEVIFRSHRPYENLEIDEQPESWSITGTYGNQIGQPFTDIAGSTDGHHGRQVTANNITAVNNQVETIISWQRHNNPAPSFVKPAF